MISANPNSTEERGLATSIDFEVLTFEVNVEMQISRDSLSACTIRKAHEHTQANILMLYIKGRSIPAKMRQPYTRTTPTRRSFTVTTNRRFYENL
ncbi:hypothetical protein OESDEN_01238 [Oesophagostomum dentatum]|uniref:Uncharacterized protein n=1 Tax=Oesophagostomum dentatum TaxID=61180 RepID=A0A0B1TMK2_OESDE|nr:hypothetical protein OESDEN_01238 [Oesophagostomum dentatum]